MCLLILDIWKPCQWIQQIRVFSQPTNITECDHDKQHDSTFHYFTLSHFCAATQYTKVFSIWKSWCFWWLTSILYRFVHSPSPDLVFFLPHLFYKKYLFEVHAFGLEMFAHDTGALPLMRFCQTMQKRSYTKNGRNQECSWWEQTQESVVWEKAQWTAGRSRLSPSHNKHHLKEFTCTTDM